MHYNLDEVALHPQVRDSGEGRARARQQMVAVTSIDNFSRPLTIAIVEAMRAARKMLLEERNCVTLVEGMQPVSRSIPLNSLQQQQQQQQHRHIRLFAVNVDGGGWAELGSPFEKIQTDAIRFGKHERPRFPRNYEMEEGRGIELGSRGRRRRRMSRA